MLADGRALRLLIVIQFVSMGAMEMSGPFWPLQIQHLLGPEGAGYTAMLSALVYAGPMLAAMLLTPVWGSPGRPHRTQADDHSCAPGAGALPRARGDHQ